jgi:uncharacterized protein (DUF1697 family)
MGEAVQAYVALWRGINIGGAKRVAMADLRTLLQELGFEHVRTLLNSGNAVFTAPADAMGDAPLRIQQAVADRLGVSARVVVLTATELHAACAGDPLYAPDRDPSRLLLAVLADASARSRLEPLLAQDWTPDELALGERVAYMWCPAGYIESQLVPALGKALGDAVTTRTWTTMTKLDALAAALPT